MNDTVLLDKTGQIATVTLNRPKAMNSFNQEMATALQAVTEEVANDTSVRAVLLRGSGDLFMAGGDISFFYQGLDSMPQGVPEIIDQLHASIRHLRNMSKPVLAAVHGSVAGAGISIMLAADLVIAADDTKFTLAYTSIGTSSDGGASYFLPRLVGEKKAMELLMLSEIFSATQAQQWGMLNWTCSSAELFTTAESLVKRLANGPTAAFSKIKTLVHKSWNNNLDQQFNAEAECFAKSTTTADFRQGVSAFIEKTKPEFTGE